MRMKKNLIVLGLILALSNCTFVGKKTSVNILNKSDSINLSSSFYLNYPKNGVEETYVLKKFKENKTSAEEVIASFKKFFARRVGGLTMGNSNLPLNKAFKEAKRKGDNYLIDIKINEWKDASYFLCKPDNKGDIQTLDKADVTVYIYHVRTKQLVNKQRLTSSGCPTVLLSFIPLGVNSPEGHFAKLLQKWIKTI
jgi:hypothetical protein